MRQPLTVGSFFFFSLLFVIPLRLDRIPQVDKRKEFTPNTLDTAHAPVVQTLDSAIHWINHYPLDNSIGFAGVYPLDSDLSGGQRYPSFEQLGPVF